MIPKQTAFFRFGSVDQARGSKQLQIGELIRAQNVRQTSKRGVYAKRCPFALTTPTYSGGTLTAVKTAVANASGALLMSDTSGQAWTYAAASTTFTQRGRMRQPFATWKQSMPVSAASIKTQCALAGTQLWQFTSIDADSKYYYSVTDVTTGAAIVPATAVTVTGTDLQLQATSDGTYVWVILKDATAIKCHKYVAATPATAAVVTTFYTPTDMSIQVSIGAKYLAGVGKTAVVINWRDHPSNYNEYSYRAYIDTATGLPSSSPAAVTTTLTWGGSSMNVGHNVRILEQPAATTTWYYTSTWVDSLDGNKQVLRLWKITASDLSSATVDLDKGTSYTDYSFFGDTVGHYDGTNVNVYIQQAGVGATWKNVIDRYVYDGASITKTAALMRGAVVSSYPFLLGGNWWIITGYDDTDATAAGLQLSAHARTIDGVVQMQFAYGEMAAFGRYYVPVYSSNKAYAPLIQQSAIAGQRSPGLATVETDGTSGHAVSPAVQMGGKAYLAGGLPATFNVSDQIHEIAPMQFPSNLTTSGGTGTGPIAIAALYSYSDADGTLYRSAPITYTATINLGATATVATLRHGANASRARIEFYAAASGGQLQYQTSIANDPTVDTLTWTVTNNTGGETLYTAGGGLSAAPLPPSQTVGMWRNRLFVASGNVLWFSQEMSPGFGPLLNEVLRATWAECDGEITAICPIDYNYCAIFTKDKIAVISGPGPDGIGQGNYMLQTLSANIGCSNAASVVNGPAGCFFQESATGRIFVVTPSLQVVEAAEGARDYASDTITAAVWVPTERQMRFFTSYALRDSFTGAVIVIDVGNPTESAPFGQVYYWPSASVVSTAAAFVDSTGPAHLNASGNLMRETSSTANYWVDYYDGGAGIVAPVYMRLTTGRLQPANAIGEINVSRAQLLATQKSHGSLPQTWKIVASVSPDGTTYTTAATYSFAPTAGTGEGTTIDMSFRPAALARTDGVFVDIAESADAPTNGKSFEFEAIALEYQPRGHLKAPNSGGVF